VIAEPPSLEGALQVIDTLLPVITVDGVPGAEGIVAGKIAPPPTAESALIIGV